MVSEVIIGFKLDNGFLVNARSNIFQDYCLYRQINLVHGLCLAIGLMYSDEMGGWVMGRLV